MILENFGAVEAEQHNSNLLILQSDHSPVEQYPVLVIFSFSDLG